MPEIKNNFLQGKMNKDLDDRLLPNGQYRDASNIQISKSENSDVGTVQNIKGNDYAYASAINAGTNVETIGYYKNDLTKEIFWFVTDFTGSSDETSSVLPSQYYAPSSAICKIYYFKIGSSSIPILLLNSFRLNFSKKHPILHVNLMDDLLFWTDDYNQPRRINLRLALTNLKADNTGNSYYENDEYLEDKISVAQYAPPTAPKVIMSAESTSDVSSLHIKNKFVKFAYRFQYENNEYSLISPFTQTCFHPGKGKTFNTGSFGTGESGMLTSTDEENIVKQTTVESMQNLANRVQLFIDLPSIIDKPSAGAATADGVWSGTSNSITTPITSGSINSNDILLTARGDKYTVSSFSSPTVVTSTSVSPSIIDDTTLYFFNNIASYDYGVKIKKIQILYSESNSTALKVVDTIKYDDIKNDITHRAEPISGGSAKLIYGYKYVYDSTKPTQTLPESDLTRVTDIIPVKAKTQEISGNRVIYGNFRQNRTLDNALTKDRFEILNGDQSKFNDQYLLSSVKSNREYSVGLVLSDRYGRQSTVFLPTNNTTFVTPKTGVVTNGTSSWKHSVVKVDFKNLIQDVYNADTNPLGWYSYKVVVKQSQQEYYNVYAPTLIGNIPSGNIRSWLVLHGDNVNKVPRDVTDINTETGTQGSQTKLLPKILDLSGTQTQSTGTDFVEVISIGTKAEQGFSSINDFYLNEKGPLLAELPDGYGRNHVASTTFDNLTVLETEPFVSQLDIYYETSTAGLISHLNAAITATLGSIPNNIALSTSSAAESLNSGDTVATISSTDTSNIPVSNPVYTIVSITDGDGTNRAGAFTISGSNLLSGEEFEFTNSNTDNYTIKIKVTDGNGNTLEQNKSISITNVAPTISVGATPLSITASTSSGTAIRTITAVNGSQKTSAQGNNLTFSITSASESGVTQSSYPFTINSSTGVLSTLGSLTNGNEWDLVIQVSDAGNLTDSATLEVNITTASYASFYISEGDTVCGTEGVNVCSDQVGSQKWHNGATSGFVAPEEGDTVYSDQNGTVFNGGGYCYAFSAYSDDGTGNPYYATISSSGIIGPVLLCSD